MRAMLALVLHLGGVGECVRLIWEWSVHNQEFWGSTPPASPPVFTHSLSMEEKDLLLLAQQSTAASTPTRP